jgi:competence protein ComEC
LISSIPASPEQFKIRWIIGLLINLTVFLFGFELTRQRMISDSTTNIVTDAEGWYAGEVIETVSNKGKISKTVISVRFNHKAGKWLPVVGKSLINLKMQQTMVPLQFGDFILIYTRFQEVTDNGNPNSFNYAKYLKNRGIFYTAWVEENSWKQLQVKTTHPLRKFAFRLRDRILDLLRENQVGGDEFSVAAALLLGYGDELDSDLRNSYAATGVTHILSVSGMHVGIIFLFLEFMLGFMNKNRLGKVMKLVIMTASIWFYAFLTGLSPAVLRAATMLSFILAGRSLKRSPEILNILAASLFFLLAYNPVLLRDIGFQLSYLAVLGIVLLYRPINNLVFFRNWIARKGWSLLSVTLAAQLTTAPLSLFYFHQFPNYFFITNLIVVPFSSLIIYSGIAAVAIGTVPFLSMIGAKILTCLVGALNFFIHFMENLPGSTSRGIFLSIPEMFLLYLIIGAGGMFFIQRKKTAIFTLLVGLILLNGSLFSRQINRLNRTRITIYNLRNMPAYEFTVQDRAIVWYDLRHLSHFQTHLERNFPTIENNWNEEGIRNRVAVWSGNRTVCSPVNFLSDQIFRKGCFIQFLGKRIGILKEKIPAQLRQTISLDYLILSCDAKASIREILKVFKVKMIIIDGMNSTYRIAAWCKEAKGYGVSCYPVSLKGAFREEL